MKDLSENVLLFFRALARYRWFALVSTVVFSLAGWAFVYQMQDQYVARARVFVDSNRILGPLLKGIAVQDDVNQRVRLMSRTLLNRPNLEQLIRDTDLNLTATTELDRESLIDSVRSRINLSGVRGNSSLYSITYQDTERDRAKLVVQQLVTVFIEESLGEEREDSNLAQAFLNDQIDALASRLSDSERRLSDFKRENSGKMPGEAGGYYARLTQATSKANETRLQLEEARNRQQLLARRLQQERPTLRGGELGGFSASPLETQLVEQQQELVELSLRYTARHPRIAQLKSSIEQLQLVIDEERAGERPSTLRYSIIANPAYQDLRAAFTESEGRVAELEVRVNAYDLEVAELEATVDSIPRIEAELLQLTRDYDTVRTQYETLLNRRESARLSEQVDQNVDNVKFRIVDPPFVPFRPTAPDKPILSLAVLGAAIAIGSALALGLSALFPVYYSATAVAAASGRHEIGSVSEYMSRGDRLHSTLSWTLVVIMSCTLLGVGAIFFLLFNDTISIGQLEDMTGIPMGDLLDTAGASLDRFLSALKDGL